MSALLIAVLSGCACQKKSASDGSPKDGGIIVRVNDVSIYQRDFISTLGHAEKVFSQKHGQLSEDERNKLRERILKKMIDDELLVQHAADQGVQVSAVEVTSELERLKLSGGGDAAFVLFLEQTGLEPDRVRANLKKNMILRRLTDRIRAAEQVSEQAIADYYNKHLDDFSGAGSVELSHLLFKGSSGAEQARKVRKQILAGLSFAEAARKYSQDLATKNQGGGLGVLKKGEMLPDLEAAAFGLEEGACSTPVESPAGFHLLKVTHKRAATTRSLTEAEPQILEMILDSLTERKIRELVARLEKSAKIERIQTTLPD